MSSNSTNLNGLFENAIRDNWDNTSLSDYGGNSFTFRDVGERILVIHRLFESYGIKKGDKVALLGKNSAQWGIIYIATVTYGTVIVPILPDFKPKDIHNIVTHSDAVLLFVEEAIYKDLNPASMPLLNLILKIPELTVLYSREAEKVLQDLSGIQQPVSSNQQPATSSQKPEAAITPDLIRFPASAGEDIAVISYTSGTTGFSKGVVLQHKSLLGNILYAHRNMPLNPKDKILSFLPLAHTYGCAFEFLFPFTLGCDITFLTKTPSPKIIMQAFQDIRPALILSVPLVIEKDLQIAIDPGTSETHHQNNDPYPTYKSIDL